MQGSNSTYFGNIKEAVSSLLQGLRLSFQHFREAKESRKPVGVEDDSYFEQQTGIVTLQYPKESLPVPDNGRYRLHNEIEDCIVCDKCAKICPVDCIEIEPVRAVEEIGRTSDGTPKRLYAATFDIDMGKCCFCGLCTIVCPTECLTMTQTYDFSEFDSADHIYAFSEMSPLEILQKKKELEEYTKQKEAEKRAKSTAGTTSAGTKPVTARPGVARPGRARPTTSPKPVISKLQEENSGENKEAKPVPRPTFKPRIKPVVKDEGGDASGEAEKPPSSGAQPKPVMKPKIKASAEPGKGEENGNQQAPKASRPVVKSNEQTKKEEEGASSEETKKPRPVVKPKVVPKNPSEEEKSESDKQEEQKVKPGYKPKPVIRKKKGDE